MSMKGCISIQDAVEHCNDELPLIPSAFLSVFPNNFGINLCCIKGFEVDLTDDGQYKSIKVNFIPASKEQLEADNVPEGFYDWVKEAFNKQCCPEED